jgi:hypothetical protein
MATEAKRPKYKFIKGTGDSRQEAQLDVNAREGFRPVFMIYDSNAASYGNNEQIVVLMAKED